MADKARKERVAASFISRYFELLMTAPNQLGALYLPKAQFNHEGKTSGITGVDNITRALSRLYPTANHGRISVKDMWVQDTERGRFVISIGATYFRRGSSHGDEYRYLIELEEHEGSKGVFGIFSDNRQDLNKPEPVPWSQETPPMLARNPTHDTGLPDLVQPPATVTITKEATPKHKPATPKVDPVPAKEEVPVAAPAAVAEKEAPAAPAAEPSTAVRKTFAELMREKAGKPISIAPAPVIEAKSAETKAKEKEEAEKKAKEEAEKKEAKKERRPRRNNDEKKEVKEGEDTEKKDKKEGDEKRSERPPRKERSSNAVVFYDVIVKGLNASATDKSVAALIGGMGPIGKINVKSQPDKKDASITRTFAFVLFDRDAISAAGTTVAAVVKKVIDESKVKFANQRVQVDEVREKYTHDDKKEKADN